MQTAVFEALFVSQSKKQKEKRYACKWRTVVWEVVDEDDLSEQVRGHGVDDAVHGPQQRGERLVVEDDDDGGVGEGGREWDVGAPARQEE